MDNFIIRKAKKSDCLHIFQLIKEIASYEKMTERIKTTEKDLERDGFGESPFFHCFVAEQSRTDTKSLVGYILYFYIYSTFEGRSVYVEDIYVTANHRRCGIGTKLWKVVAKEAVEKECRRMDFVVLEWNTPSIEFYEKLGAVNLTVRDKWHLFRLEHKALSDVANS